MQRIPFAEVESVAKGLPSVTWRFPEYALKGPGGILFLGHPRFHRHQHTVFKLHQDRTVEQFSGQFTDKAQAYYEMTFKHRVALRYWIGKPPYNPAPWRGVDPFRWYGEEYRSIRDWVRWLFSNTQTRNVQWMLYPWKPPGSHALAALLHQCAAEGDMDKAEAAICHYQDVLGIVSR